MKKYFRLMRPYQWLKQALVFMPVLSLGRSIDTKEISLAFLAAMTFTFAASIVYALNDISDAEKDKLDPFRAKRPLASGAISIVGALIFIFVNCVILFSLICLFSSEMFKSLILIAVYIIVNIIYSSCELKNLKIIGVILVAVGYPIRFAFGCTFLGIQISIWAMVLLTQLALFMLGIKRYQRAVRTNTDPKVQANNEFWLLATIVFVAFFASTYSNFISSPVAQGVWGNTALLFSTIPIMLSVARVIEIGTNPKRIKESDITDVLYKDIFLVLLSAIYMLIMLLGSLTSG
jgi:decaprenyl-phosphate phosphoribosyltransferase